MTATNHAVTGALVAAAINQPLLSLPAALLSHFVIDGWPHWDYYEFIKIASLKKVAPFVDFSLALSLLLIFAFTVKASVWLIVAGGLLGILPDTMWLSFILKGTESIKGNLNSPLNRIRRWHLDIQWLETPKLAGLYAELAWLVITVLLIYQVHR